MNTKKRVAHVFRFPNGVIAVTGYDGQQITELQGHPSGDDARLCRYEDAEYRTMLETAADADTKWHGWPGKPESDF